MKSTKQLIIVGDRVLIRPDDSAGRTEAGLYLPEGVKEKEKANGGYVVKTGPGYMVTHPASVDDPAAWREPGTMPRYIRLEAAEGDYAIFLRNDAVEIDYEGRKYLIVPHRSILALIRTEIIPEE